jgi:hypothetical protein
MADKVQAAQMLLSYKRGAINREQVSGLLCSICGMTWVEAGEAIADADKMPLQYLQRQEQAWFDSKKQSKN